MWKASGSNLLKLPTLTRILQVFPRTFINIFPTICGDKFYTLPVSFAGSGQHSTRQLRLYRTADWKNIPFSGGGANLYMAKFVLVRNALPIYLSLQVPTLGKVVHAEMHTGTLASKNARAAHTTSRHRHHNDASISGTKSTTIRTAVSNHNNNEAVRWRTQYGWRGTGVILGHHKLRSVTGPVVKVPQAELN